MVAAILVASGGAAAVWWMKQHPQKPPGAPEETIVTKAPAAAPAIASNTKASPNSPSGRAPEKSAVTTGVSAMPKESSTASLRGKTAARAESERVADKKPQEASKAAALKQSAPKAEIKPKAEVQTPPASPPMEKPRIVVRDTAKPDAPTDRPKPAGEAVPPKAAPSPPPADAPKNPVAEPAPVAGTQYIAPKLALFGSIDKHALAAPPDAEESIPSLTAYLIKPAKNDLEKLRAIYRWITDRIAYDVDDFFNGRPGIADPDVVLKKRLAVCEGYSRLFKAMCDDAHVEAVVVSGYGKSLGYEPGKEKLNEFKHAWNAVKLGGGWYLLDVTWATGHVRERKFVKKLNELHFLTRPDQFVFRHLPREPRWQLVSKPLTLEQWEALPIVDDTLFAAGLSSQTS